MWKCGTSCLLISLKVVGELNAPCRVPKSNEDRIRFDLICCEVSRSVRNPGREDTTNLEHLLRDLVSSDQLRDTEKDERSKFHCQNIYDQACSVLPRPSGLNLTSDVVLGSEIINEDIEWCTAVAIDNSTYPPVNAIASIGYYIEFKPTGRSHCQVQGVLGALDVCCYFLRGVDSAVGVSVG